MAATKKLVENWSAEGLGFLAGWPCPSEVCQIWRLNKGSFRNRMSQGRGPVVVRLGRSVRFTPKAVREWIAAQTDPGSRAAPGDASGPQSGGPPGAGSQPSGHTRQEVVLNLQNVPQVPET